VSTHFDVLIPSAGGTAKVPGDYVWRTWTADQFQVGVWGLFRVAPTLPVPVVGFPDTIAISDVAVEGNGQVAVSGVVTLRPSANAAERTFAPQLRVDADGTIAMAAVDDSGHWTTTFDKEPSHIEVTSPNGGVAQWTRAPPRAIAPLAAAAELAGTRPTLVPPRVTLRGRRHIGIVP
jgi:hypothetical protein